MDHDEFIARLKDKLIEEASEVAQVANEDELVEELADVLEVVHALVIASGVTMENVERTQQAKRLKRGGFDERIYNAAIEAESSSPAIDYYLSKGYQEIEKVEK